MNEDSRKETKNMNDKDDNSFHKEEIHVTYCQN